MPVARAGSDPVDEAVIVDGDRDEHRIALAPPPGNPRFPAMDGLRAIAALSVVVFHVALDTRNGAGGGWHRWVADLTWGPSLFFVLSGFLLYRPFVAARVLGTPRPTVRGFLRKRALRILPGYWCALTVTAAVPLATGVALDGDWWRFYALVQIYSPETVFGGLGPAWTVATEASFYLVLPLAALGAAPLARRFGARRARTLELAALAVVGILSILWIRHFGSVSPADTAKRTWLPGTSFCFAAGMALAVVTVPLDGSAPARRAGRRWPLLLIACWAAALAVYALRMEMSAIPHRVLANGAIGILLTVPAAFAPRVLPPPGRWLGAGLLAWLGLISYGLYLYHQPILRSLSDAGVGAPGAAGFLALLGLGTAVAVGVGALSYYAVELPLLRFKYRRRPLAGAVRPGTEPA